MKELLAEVAGWTLCLLAVTDLYLSVLYARSDIGFLSSCISGWVWRSFRQLARLLPKGTRSRFLTFAGPTIVVLILLSWLGLLLFGFALVTWPALGSEIRKSSGPTSTEFTTAIYYSGYTLATLGFGDIVPASPFYRLVAVAEALLGFSVLTLGVTYILSIYSALVRRNSLALVLHHRSSGTDDAVELLARMLVSGDSSASVQLSDVAGKLHDLYESHHSYPILHYFHFRDPFYAMAHIVGTIADVATLARTAVDRKQHKQFTDSAAVAEALSGSTFLLKRLAEVFLPTGFQPREGAKPSEEAAEQWRARFHAASRRLAEAGIAVASDRDAAADCYVQHRQAWDSYVKAFGRYMLTGTAGRSRSEETEGRR